MKADRNGYLRLLNSIIQIGSRTGYRKTYDKSSNVNANQKIRKLYKRTAPKMKGRVK